MKYILTIAISLMTASLLQASLVNFQSGKPATIVDSSGTTITDVVFSLGTWDGSNFTDEMDGTNAWLTSGPPPVINTFQGERAMTDGSSDNAQAYIWAEQTSTGQYALVENASWIFPTYDALDTTADIFSFRDSGTATVSGFGNYDYASGVLTLVPEPSSAALLAGMLALGSVMLRRRAA